MHYYIQDTDTEHLESLGEPKLFYTDYCNEKDRLHPRSLHSHHGYVEILYIVKGDGLFEIDGKTYDVAPGDLVVYNTDVLHNENLISPPPSDYAMAASGIQIDGLPANHIISPGQSPVIHLNERADEFKNLFQMLFEESKHQTAQKARICQSLFYSLLLMVMELVNEEVPVSTESDKLSKSERLGKEILSYVDEHLLSDISLPQVAEAFNISPTYLSRLFKQVAGMPMMQYVIQRRIGEAQTLLMITDMSVGEIAVSVGYTNLSHFVKIFTQNVGISPRNYRKINGSVTKGA